VVNNGPNVWLMMHLGGGVSRRQGQNGACALDGSRFLLGNPQFTDLILGSVGNFYV
jgi:hypothetical protein